MSVFIEMHKEKYYWNKFACAQPDGLDGRNPEEREYTQKKMVGDERPTSQKHYPIYDQNLRFFLHYPRLLPRENFREPFGLPKIKVGSPSHNFRSPELISD